MFVPNFKILSAVVPEKSLTKKSLHTDTDRQTDRQINLFMEKDKNYISPIYFVRQGYTIMYLPTKGTL